MIRELTKREIDEIVKFDAGERAETISHRPTRKTMRYNVIVPQGGKAARTREVMVYHVGVALTKGYRPRVKVVGVFDPVTDLVRIRHIDYHQIGGWIAEWSDEEMSEEASVYSPHLGDFSAAIETKFRDGLRFPWHATVNVGALAGTRYEYCQYRGGNGLCDWLSCYQTEPRVELLAKAGLDSLVSPSGIAAIRKPGVLGWVRDNLDGVRALELKGQEVLWAINHGKTPAQAEHHFSLVRDFAGAFRHFSDLKVRLDYERAEKIVKSVHATAWEYVRYLSYAQRAGLDLRNEGTVYPPTRGGREAFMARLEKLEASAARRERRAAKARRDAELCELLNVTKDRLGEVLSARAGELAAFQAGLAESATLVGRGYSLVVQKSQDDLLKEGKRMHNCVGNGTYGEAVVRGDTIIVTIFGINGQKVEGRDARFCVEISRKTWRVVQCYGISNSAAPDEVKRLAAEIAKRLKEINGANRKRKEFAVLRRRAG